jgi:uncharacterized membrane protein YuzA (DUF378 family)
MSPKTPLSIIAILLIFGGAVFGLLGSLHAIYELLAALYADYAGWPRLFPATIRGARLLADDGQRRLRIG